MKFRVLTLFPEMFNGFISSSIIGKAVESGKISVVLDDIRSFSTNRHKKVDDAPFGGGAGMVMTVQPLKDALLSTPVSPDGKVVYLSPKGKPLTHEMVSELAKLPELVLVCGHYEGVDQRFIDRYVDEEVSIGDYVLTGGEVAAMVIVDSVSRMIDDVLKNSESAEDDSFANGILEYPHYTRPAVYEGDAVPDVLLSGNHAEINKWRLKKAIEITRERRPDLYQQYIEKTLDDNGIK